MMTDDLEKRRERERETEIERGGTCNRKNSPVVDQPNNTCQSVQLEYFLDEDNSLDITKYVFESGRKEEGLLHVLRMSELPHVRFFNIEAPDML